MPKRNSRILFAVLAGLILLAGGTLSGQQQQPSQPPPPPSPQQAQPQPPPQQPVGKISVEVKLVTLYATVRDKHGKIVPTLNKEDFTLDEDGRPQTISHFVRETDVPLTLGLLVDTSLSQRYVLSDERDASYTFLDHMLRVDKDKAFLIHFDREVELLQDLTSSRPKLQAALQLLETPSLNRTADDDDGQMRSHAGTLLYDAVYLASNELMKKQQGRKALFVLSDGVDRGSKESLGTAIEAAQRADTSVYSILFAGQESQDQGSGHHGGWGGMGRGPGVGWPGGGGGYPGGGGGYPGGGGGRRPSQEGRADGKKVLERLATETGGQLFEVSKKLPIDQIYAQIEEELRNQYSLGYTPTPSPDAGYHKIHLTTSQKDMTVQARDGYYSGQ